MSDTRCDCPKPPGGAVSCESGNVAYCSIVNGEINAGCISLSALVAPGKSPTTIMELALSTKVSEQAVRKLLHIAMGKEPTEQSVAAAVSAMRSSSPGDTVNFKLEQHDASISLAFPALIGLGASGAFEFE